MGNRSTGGGPGGGRRIFVKLPGYLVHAQVCIPAAPPLALWLLAWLEQLLEGMPLAQLELTPPWPVPADPLVARQLSRELIDRRWAVPNWAGDGVVVAPRLAARYRAEGRMGLAQELFAAIVIPGEWWMDGIAGTLLMRQTAVQFDWDLRHPWDEELAITADAQRVLDGARPDVMDLLRKLGGSSQVREARDRAFLGSPLRVGSRKDLLFPLYGYEARILPDELAELEPMLTQHAPALLGVRKTQTRQQVQLPRSAVERWAAELEQLPVDPVTIGPLEPLRERVDYLKESLAGAAGAELCTWLASGYVVRPVAGDAAMHFHGLAKMCAALAHGPAGSEPWLLCTSAFLSAESLEANTGLVAAFAAAPAGARFLILYGHANDDLPEKQQHDLESFRQRLRSLAGSLVSRCLLVPGVRRSHEKIIVTSAGDWLLGSWNPASSRADSPVFECSLTGRDAGFALRLLRQVEVNIAAGPGRSACGALATALTAATVPHNDQESTARRALDRLQKAVSLLEPALPTKDRPRGGAWGLAVRAVQAAFSPFFASAKLELVDEQQTRDVFAAYVAAARSDVLLASDRLADSALDPATLRDLRGVGPTRRTIRMVWGREPADQHQLNPQARTQHQRAKMAVQEAREILGAALRTSSSAMGNHAKLLLCDGLRGIVTSENLLRFGGEKSRHGSRELGIAFSCPPLARYLLGVVTSRWRTELLPERGQDLEPPYHWLALGLEAARWHVQPWTSAELAELRQQLGGDPLPWLQAQGEKLGLLCPSDTEHWRPYYAANQDEAADSFLTRARDAQERQSAPPHIHAAEAELPQVGRRPAPGSRQRAHPLVERVLSTMCRIRAGAFRMGDDRVPREGPRHRVVISQDFLLGSTPVTQDLWEDVTGRLPMLRDTVERHPRFPIIYVDYLDIQRFLAKLNALPGGGGFALPTEAQWEYACRAGSDDAYCFGNDPGIGDRPGRLEEFAWTKRNAQMRLQQVAQLKPNAWGLYDMHGLVYETMRDGFRTYTREAQRDPVGPLDGGTLVARGGSWGRSPIHRDIEGHHFRCASRQTHQKSHRVSFRILGRVEE